ncbi:MAG: chromate transporter [Hespellia sp.]|nr:chromate transporter [Hespellia sp.]
MIYLTLFYEFFKIGLFAIGGGMATIPFLIDLSAKYNWYTTSEFANMVAISQSTPGPVGINMATYAGFEAAGIPGALIATLSLVLPSIVIIIIIARFMQNFSDNPIVKAVFNGIRPTVAALILYAVLELSKISLLIATDSGYKPDYLSIFICIVMFLLMEIPKLKKLHPLVWIAAGAVLGIIFKL